MKKLVLVLTAFWLCLPLANAFGEEGIDDYTVLMLHGNGTDSSTDIVDSSFSDHTVTAYGDAQLDTNIKKFGNASLQFDGTGDYLATADNNDWYFSNKAFTLDFWVNFNSLAGTQTFLSQGVGAPDLTEHWTFWKMDPSLGNRLQFQGTCNIEGTYKGAVWVDMNNDWNPVENTWYHLAFVRDPGVNSYIFIDGVSQNVNVQNNEANISIYDIGYPLYTGQYGDGRYYMNGWLDEVRISNGVARWTSDFDPATGEYVIPEPASLLLLGLGIGGMATAFRKNKRAK